MSLRSNGQLLIKVRQAPFAALVGEAGVVLADGYSVEPLFQKLVRQPFFDAGAPADHWFLAKPAGQSEAASKGAASNPNPWDEAHSVAAESGYQHYVEPDILHESPARAQAAGGWPPAAPVSAGWHLATQFTGFESVRGVARGAGVRVAHLDTGFTPDHLSKPTNLKPDLGYDFWSNKAGAVDPYDADPWDQPGHGTATLALLAGAKIDLPVGEIAFDSEIGGAPDAEVIPVRVSPSVVHIYTSSMAKGLDYALNPGDGRPCDVITISHGGLPTAAWADAVNQLYEAGTVIVAASGDNFPFVVVDLATRFTVYPSAFNRVVTAVGATYAKTPYISNDPGVMQGNWGPDAVMEKAIAGFTPKVAWMDYRSPGGFTMDGGGTSASTPQIAAACALWLQLYADRLPRGWQRVEACRVALWESAGDNHQDPAHLGWGWLNVPQLLDQTRANDVIQRARSGALQASAIDEVSFPFWRLLVGAPPPGSEQERMYETEAAQIVQASQNTALVLAAQHVANGGGLSDNERDDLKRALLSEDLSGALRTRVGPETAPTSTQQRALRDGDQTMNKSDAVTNAVLDQLKADGRPIDNLDKILNKAPMPYNDMTLDNCLVGVSNRLKNGNPSYDFEYDDVFVANALVNSINDLIESVLGQTT